MPCSSYYSFGHHFPFPLLLAGQQTTPTSENIDTYAEAVSLIVGLGHGPRDRNHELDELFVTTRPGKYRTIY
jgi:hypothetical protein